MSSLGFLKESEFLSCEILQKNYVERNSIYHYVFSVIYRTSNYPFFCFNVYTLGFEAFRGLQIMVCIGHSYYRNIEQLGLLKRDLLLL